MDMVVNSNAYVQEDSAVFPPVAQKKSQVSVIFYIKDCLKHIGIYYQNCFGLFFLKASRFCQLRQA